MLDAIPSSSIAKEGIKNYKIISMNKINEIAHLSKYKNSDSYLYDNHQDWERQRYTNANLTIL